MFEPIEPELILLRNTKFKLAQRLRWRGKPRAVDVPPGFVTDLASVPRALWALLPPHGNYAPAAIVHDFMYAKQFTRRAVADKVLLEGMKVLRVPRWQRWAIYAGVRAGGWLAWKRKRMKK